MTPSILRPRSERRSGPGPGPGALRPLLHSRFRLRETTWLLLFLTIASGFWSGRPAELQAREPAGDSSQVGRPVRLALFPFVRGKNVSDFEYEQISAAFHLELSRSADFQIVPRFELGRILNAAEEAGEKFQSPEPIYALAAANRIDLLVFGSVGAEVRLQHRGVDLRSVGLKVEIVNVPRKQVFNTVAWSTNHLSGQNIQEGEKIADLATMTAGKLTWSAPSLFPIRVVFDASSREIIPRSYDADESYKTRVRDRLDALKLPRGVEVDSVLVNVREKRELSTLGAVGCVTLVGWLFMPFYEIDYDLDILARIKYPGENGVEYREFAEAGHETESFHIAADAEKYEQPTLKLLARVTEQIYGSIRGDRRLLQDRSELLRKLFLKSAEAPENI